MDAHCGTTFLNTSSDHRLPSDVFDHILSILEVRGQSASLAKVAQCSSSMCQRVIPYLYRSFTLDDKSVNWILKSISQDQPSGQVRHQHIFSTVRSMVVRPITQPISTEATRILKTTKPSGIFPNLQHLSIIGPPLSSSQSFDDILTLLAQTCSPRKITFELTESACGYYAFRGFIGSPKIKKTLSRLIIHNMHTSYLRRPSPIEITVSFRDHLCTPRDQYGRIKNGKRCSWDCDERFAEVILHYLQSYPGHSEFPPLRIVERIKTDLVQMEPEGAVEEKEEDEDEDEESATESEQSENEYEDMSTTDTDNLRTPRSNQLTMIASKLDKMINREAAVWKYNPDQDEKVRLANIEKWQKRVVFVDEVDGRKLKGFGDEQENKRC
ncbi:uncharacterized protein L199_001097 [Kwoniella botswanensis]|uniref:uncharacterized protein n=1 Tax=Kwoniella botswanensis TaxID=1268659 RepID=UPI00315DC8AE